MTEFDEGKGSGRESFGVVVVAVVVVVVVAGRSLKL